MPQPGDTQERQIVRAVLDLIDAEEARDENKMAECLIRAIGAGKALRHEQRLMQILAEAVQ